MKLNFIHRNVEFSVEFENDISLHELTSLIEVELDLNLTKFRCIIVHGEEIKLDMPYISDTDIPDYGDALIYGIKPRTIIEEVIPSINCNKCIKNNILCETCMILHVSDLGLLDNDNIIVNIDYTNTFLCKFYTSLTFNTVQLMDKFSSYKNTYKLLSEEYNTRLLLRALIKIDPLNFILIKYQTLSLCKFAIRESYNNMEYVDNQSNEICIPILERIPYVFDYIRNPTYEMILVTSRCKYSYEIINNKYYSNPHTKYDEIRKNILASMK